MEVMYKNRAANGKNNVCGDRVRIYREALPSKPSQKGLADLLQLEGLDLDKNAVQRIESGQRFVTDIELSALAKVFGVTADEFLKNEEDPAS